MSARIACNLLQSSCCCSQDLRARVQLLAICPLVFCTTRYVRLSQAGNSSRTWFAWLHCEASAAGTRGRAVGVHT